jgi:S1-C subfamily serine protease
VQIKTVLRGGPAEKAGMAAGDEWLGIDVKGQGWRISKLEDVAFYAGTETSLTALVARDGRLLRLPLELSARSASTPPKKTSRTTPATVPDTVSLSIANAGTLGRWLN